MTTDQRVSDNIPALQSQLDWSASYTPLGSPGQSLITDALWESAITYDSGSIEEMLTDPSTYHARVGLADALVGIRFDFTVRESRIIATGRVHPAREDMRGDYHTFTDDLLEERDILVFMRSEQTQRAVKNYIQETM